MSSELVAETEGAIAICRLNRPEARNALSPALMDELAAALERYDDAEAVRCIVVAGSDEVFASGADVRALAEGGGRSAARQPSAEFWRRLDAIEKPLIAAVSGWALGAGWELALACDLLVAAENARFGQPEITLGIIPGGGATQRLTRTIGKQRAMELVLTGRRISAEQAYAWGLVNVLVPTGSSLQPATELAAEIAERAPIALRLAKRAVREAERLSLDEGLEAERRLFEQAMATEDRLEGMTAFLERRRPRFEGR